ncbi:hypothetical protein [Nostoc sp. DSM 114167]|jgi:hypothetical protein|uniref:hypothetical protein n=1 Tax=Nostoc sp. DSM 114167 TaxID=3439050 RepID=UPI0040464FAB
MSTLSVIGAMQSALDCAGKCDCCDKLQAQINDIKAQLARLKNVDEDSIVRRSVKASEASIIPQIPGIAEVAATAIASGLIAPLRPKIQDAVDKASEAIGVAKSAENSASSAISRATVADLKAAQAVRDAEIATFRANVANGVATEAERRAVAAYDKAIGAEVKAVTAESSAARAIGESGKAIAEAQGATAKAVTATNTALEANSAVGGLKGIVEGLKGKVGALGEAIARAEAIANQAIIKAANAVGISTEALNGIGRLAGRIAEIFNILGTFAVLFEQLATLNVLGGRIDAVEAGLIALGNSVSGILGKLLGLQNRIGRNEALTAEAKNIALDAKGIGEAAKLQAGAAQVTATRAENFSQIANNNAKTAQTTADGAVRNATIANENATTAYKKANEAQGIGEQAKRIAGDALGKAGVALTTALTAIALYQGVRSLRGLQGIPGIPGRQGERGLQGIQGIPGIPGRDGVTTLVTLPGTPGPRGQTGRQGVPGIPGRNGRDVNPAEAASLRALIISQHTQTRANSTAQHATTRFSILTPIMAALAPIFAVCQQILAVVSAASNAAQLALLNIINSKLGAQVTGGISGLVTSVAQNTYIEKALAVLTFATTLHNALMLTNNLGQTLGSIINTILGLVLPKGLDGTPIDVGAVLGKTATTLIQDAIGADNYTKLTQEWAMANRIYQASANVFNALTNAVSTTINALEVIGSHTAKIGNALKYWGVLGQKAYEWFHPNPNFHNKYFTFLNNAEAGANTIQAVVQIPVSIVDAKNQIDSANSEFKSAIKGDKNTDGTPKESGIPTEENKDKKNEVEQSIANSQPFSFDFSDLFDGED